MADLQSMTLQERMITIINSEHSLSYGINDLSFQEACNKWLIETGTVNGVSYSGISINKYTPEEAFAIIRHKIDLRSETLNELVSELGSYYPIHKYTATEALNKKNAVLAPYSLSFDGVNDDVTVTDVAELDPVTNGQLTISCWINMDIISGDNRGIVAKREASEQSGAWSLIQSADEIMFAIYSGSGSPTSFVTTTLNLLAATWYHLVITMDDSINTYKIYINGDLEASDASAITANFANTSHPLYIGNSGQSEYFDGKIDEVSIFNKVLTQAEVTSLNAADPQNAGDAVGVTNLIGYWKFDEGSGEPQDTSGNGNHGTISGATWTVH